MIDRVETLRQEALKQIQDAKTPADLQAVRVSWLGRKGAITQLLRGLKDATPDERRQLGQATNRVKAELDSAIGSRQEVLLDSDHRLRVDGDLV